MRSSGAVFRYFAIITANRGYKARRFRYFAHSRFLPKAIKGCQPSPSLINSTTARDRPLTFNFCITLVMGFEKMNL
jgi:hypothetical protein